MDNVQMEQPERMGVKKRNSSGSKKKKKSGEVAEEEIFPTSMENLYSTRATTLTALSEMVMQEGEGDGDKVADEDGLDDGCVASGLEATEEGSQAPFQSLAAVGGVKTRSQDKLQCKTQVKRKKKRRAIEESKNL